MAQGASLQHSCGLGSSGFTIIHRCLCSFSQLISPLSHFIHYSLISGSTFSATFVLPLPQSPPKQPSHLNYFFLIGHFFLSFATPITKPDTSDIVTLAISALHSITDMVQMALKGFTLQELLQTLHNYLVPPGYILFTHSKTNHSSPALIPMPSSSYLPALSYLTHRQFA